MFRTEAKELFGLKTYQVQNFQNRIKHQKCDAKTRTRKLHATANEIAVLHN